MKRLAIILVLVITLLLGACGKSQDKLPIEMGRIQFGELTFDVGAEWEYTTLDENIYFSITEKQTSGLAVGPTSFNSLEDLINFYSDRKGERLTINGLPAYEIIRDDADNENVVYYSLYVEKSGRVYVYNFTFTKSDGMDELIAIYNQIKNSIS